MPLLVVAALPVVVGFVFQVTVFSDHDEETWAASSVRAALAADALTRRVAAVTLQPVGTAGSGNVISRRRLREPLRLCTDAVVLLPKLLLAFAWST